MSIGTLFQKRLIQTAVYWGNPVNTGYGKYTFDDPIEIKCRWEEKKQVLTSDDGEKFISRAIVFVLQDLDVDGVLYLGELDDLDSAQAEDPSTIENMAIIKRFEKTPGFGENSVYLRKAFLTPWLS